MTNEIVQKTMLLPPDNGVQIIPDETKPVIEVKLESETKKDEPISDTKSAKIRSFFSIIFLFFALGVGASSLLIKYSVIPNEAIEKLTLSAASHIKGYFIPLDIWGIFDLTLRYTRSDLMFFAILLISPFFRYQKAFLSIFVFMRSILSAISIWLLSLSGVGSYSVIPIALLYAVSLLLFLAASEHAWSISHKLDTKAAKAKDIFKFILYSLASIGGIILYRIITVIFVNIFSH